jgi:hypothetical protein
LADIVAKVTEQMLWKSHLKHRIEASARRAVRESADCQYLLPGPARTERALVGVANDTGLLFQGEMVSIMIFIPAKALSISPCTR